MGGKEGEGRGAEGVRNRSGVPEGAIMCGAGERGSGATPDGGRDGNNTLRCFSLSSCPSGLLLRSRVGTCDVQRHLTGPAQHGRIDSV